MPRLIQERSSGHIGNCLIRVDEPDGSKIKEWV
jgi:hypothetical protein